MQKGLNNLIKVLGAVAILGSTTVAAHAQSAKVPESDGPLVLGMQDWTGQDLTQRIAGEILTRMGYEVEYLQTATFPLMQAGVDGDIHAYMEMWLGTTREAYDGFVADGSLEDIGPSGLVGYEGWYYPRYVEADCPGLPNWEALKDKDCVGLFASPETFPNGRVVDYPANWTPNTQQWIDALGLDLTPVAAGGEGAIVAEIKSAVARKEPLLTMFWSPHWAISEFDMVPMELPAYDAACHTDPAWGINPNATFDCGNSITPIVKFVWPGLKDKFPAAYGFLKNYQLTNEIQAPLIKLVDVEKIPLDDVVSKWVDDNVAMWEPWTQ